MRKYCKRGHLRSPSNLYRGACRKCQYLSNLRSRKNNPDRWRENRRNSAKRHPETSLKWRHDNPEKVKKIRHRHNNKKESRRKAVIRVANWRKKNPEAKLAQEQTRRARKAGNGGSFSAAEWLALCKKYHNKCLDCGKRKKLTADHVIPISKGGSSNISNIQPLCKACNSKKWNRTKDFRK